LIIEQDDIKKETNLFFQNENKDDIIDNKDDIIDNDSIEEVFVIESDDDLRDKVSSLVFLLHLLLFILLRYYDITRFPYNSIKILFWIDTRATIVGLYRIYKELI
jgi:hypothetical protein